MGVNARSALDPRWVRHHVKVVASFMLATIKVTRKDPSVQVEYDQTTGEYTGGFTVVFEGQARVQPYGITGDQIVGQDPTARRLMRVQIEQKNTGIDIDDMIEVVVPADSTDDSLDGYYLEVRSTINSSNAWVTDLVCEANEKRK